MTVEELAKRLAEDFDKESSRQSLSASSKDFVLQKLKDTLYFIFRDLSAWLIDKYTIIDLESTNSGKVEVGVYVDYESVAEELDLQVKLFMETLFKYSGSIEEAEDSDK